MLNKKVLLRERKRHTARCVANTPYVVLTGYPTGGYRTLGTPRGGTGPWVPPQVPPRGGTRPRVPPRVPPLGGYQTSGTPPGYPLPGWTWQGTPPGWTWQGNPPTAPWHSGKCCKALWDTGTPPAAPWHSGKCCKALWDTGTPPLWTDRWMDGRTDACQNITFPRTPYIRGR